MAEHLKIVEDERSEVEKAFDNFRLIADSIGIPVPRFLTPARKAKLQQRLKDIGGLETWNEALEKLQASSFCRGEVNGWRASFDFMLQESSLLKLLEGNYDDRD